MKEFKNLEEMRAALDKLLTSPKPSPLPFSSNKRPQGPKRKPPNAVAIGGPLDRKKFRYTGKNEKIGCDGSGHYVKTDETFEGLPVWLWCYNNGQ